MKNILFIYNIILTILFTINLTGFYSIYLKNKKKVYLLYSLLQVILIVDNSITYITEFSNSISDIYDNTSIIFIIYVFLYLGIIIITRIILQESIFQDKISKWEKRGYGLYTFLILSVTLFLKTETNQIITDIILLTTIFYLMIRTYINLKSKPDLFDKKTLVKHKIWSGLILVVFGMSYFEYAIYYFVEFKSYEYIDMLYRWIAFDTVKLIVALYGIVFLHSNFAELTKDNTLKTNSNSIEDKLNDFYSQYSLTNRQKEIIVLIIKGSTNKEIGDELNITEGTVKTHIHNIFKRTELSNRNQLLNKILDK